MCFATYLSILTRKASMYSHPSGPANGINNVSKRSYLASRKKCRELCPELATAPDQKTGNRKTFNFHVEQIQHRILPIALFNILQTFSIVDLKPRFLAGECC